MSPLLLGVVLAKQTSFPAQQYNDNTW